MKSTIDVFLVERYDHLNAMAASIVRRDAVDSTDKDELFSHLVMHLYTNDNVESVIDKGRSSLEGYCVRVMTNTWKWGNKRSRRNSGTSNQQYRKRHEFLDERLYEQPDTVVDVVDTSNYDDDELLSMAHDKLYTMYYTNGCSIRKISEDLRMKESTIRKMLKDIYRKYLETEDGQQSMSKMLHPHERRLYSMYYFEDKSIRDIATKVRLSAVAVHQMLKTAQARLNSNIIPEPLFASPGRDRINKLDD